MCILSSVVGKIPWLVKINVVGKNKSVYLTKVLIIIFYLFMQLNLSWKKTTTTTKTTAKTDQNKAITDKRKKDKMFLIIHSQASIPYFFQFSFRKRRKYHPTYVKYTI